MVRSITSAFICVFEFSFDVHCYFVKRFVKKFRGYFALYLGLDFFQNLCNFGRRVILNSKYLLIFKFFGGKI